MSLTIEDLEIRRSAPQPSERVIFGVKALYGLSRGSARLPLNPDESIDSGQICLTLDPESPPSANVGMVDFTDCKLRVRYGVEAVFPGLHELVMSGKHDLNLLRPIRITAADECSVLPDFSGWHAFGCLDFLPGSMWSGAKGG
jgi:hypothetical protein